MATFNLIKITLVGIHPNPGPSHSVSNLNTVYHTPSAENKCCDNGLFDELFVVYRVCMGTLTTKRCELEMQF
jgi:hypothetical protein